MRTKSRDQIFPLMFEFGRLVRRKGYASGKHALTLPQLEALYFAGQAGEPLMREIAEYLRVKAPSATTLVEELERAGHLARSPDSLDRRQVRVRLTGKGRKTLDDLVRRKSETIEEILSVLSKKERGEFETILQSIVTANKQ